MKTKQVFITKMVSSFGMPGQVEPELVLSTRHFLVGERVRVTIELMKRGKAGGKRK